MFFIAQSMDVSRFIQVFLVQGLSGLFYLFIGYKIIKKEKRGINFILSAYYFLVFVGAVINVIYVNIFDETITLILHLITYYIFCFSLIFLFIFVLILFKSEKIINSKKQAIIISTFALLLIGFWFIPEGVRLNDITWKPEWSLFFFAYSIVVCSGIAIIPTLIISFTIYKSFQKKILKKKWIFFLIGIIGYYYLYYGTSLSNTLADPIFRLIWSIISLPTLITIYFIYYGVAKQL